MIPSTLRQLILGFIMVFSVSSGAADTHTLRMTGDWSVVDGKVLVDKLVEETDLTFQQAQQFVNMAKKLQSQAQQEAIAFKQCNSESPNASWNDCYNKVYNIDKTDEVANYGGYVTGPNFNHTLDKLWFVSPEDVQEFANMGTAAAAKLR